MNRIERFKTKIKIKRLKENMEYSINKMKEHINDDDPKEFNSWKILSCFYLTEIMKCKVTLLD